MQRFHAQRYGGVCRMSREPDTEWNEEVARLVSDITKETMITSAETENVGE